METIWYVHWMNVCTNDPASISGSFMIDFKEEFTEGFIIPVGIRQFRIKALEEDSKRIFAERIK